jgi:ABC-2 type transport system permease protein
MIKLKKYLLVAKTSLQNSLAYASNFIVDTFFYAFILFIFLQLWKVIYGSGDMISGYTLNQMIWYCVVTEMITHCGSNVFGELNSDIKGGNIAYLLNKPYHYVTYQLSNSLGQIAVKFVLNGVAAIVIGLVYIGPLKGFAAASLPFVLLSILLGLLLNFFILAAVGLTAFWLEENRAFYWILQKLVFMLGMFLPIEFFPEELERIVRTLPFPYITYGPAKLAVDFSSAKCVEILSMQAMYLLVFLAVSFLLYAKGVKKLNVNGG